MNTFEATVWSRPSCTTHRADSCASPRMLPAPAHCHHSIEELWLVGISAKGMADDGGQHFLPGSQLTWQHLTSLEYFIK